MMKKSYNAMFALAALFFFGQTALAQSITIDFEAGTDGDVTFSESNTTWTNGQIETAGSPTLYDVGGTPTGWRTDAGATSQVVISTGGVAVARMFFTSIAGGGAFARAFSNVDCSTGQLTPPVGENAATTQGDLANWVEFDGGGTDIACITIDNSAGAGPAIVDGFTFGNFALPVELTSFDAVTNGNSATLRWNTASEENNQGFSVQMKVNGYFQEMGFVEGVGSSKSDNAYSYQVNNLAPGTHVFRLKQVDFDGSFGYSDMVEVSIDLPGEFSLSPAYPNPFNPQTKFTLTVKQSQHVAIQVYDLLGRQVMQLFDGNLVQDEAREFTFEASNLSSGIYLIRAVGDNFTTARQVTLLK